MANEFYDNSDSAQRFQPGTTARSDEVDAKFDQVATGFDAVNIETDRALKFPTENGVSQEFTATILQRRRKVLGFDENGDFALQSGFNYRGDWASTTDYFVNDVFRDAVSKNLYVVAIRHTAAVLYDDLAAGSAVIAINLIDVEAFKTQASESAAEAAQTLSDTEAVKLEADAARDAAQAAQLLSKNWATSQTVVGNNLRGSKYYADIAQAAAATLAEGTINDAVTDTNNAWSSQKITDELQLQATRALTLSLTAPPTTKDSGDWEIEASATSRHSGGAIAGFEVNWWDGTTETVSATGAAATLARAVDQPVGGTVSATIRALDDIGNASASETVSASVVANNAPGGPITIAAPTQTGKNSTFQVSLSGATDSDGDPVTYVVTDTGAFVFAKITGIAEGEIVEVTAPDVTDDTDFAFSVAAEDDVGARSAASIKTISVLAAQVIGVALRATGGPGGTWDHIDEAGSTIATPSLSWFNGHPIFGGMQDVSVDGQVMVEVPKFYYKRGTAGGDAAWWISDQPIAGFTVMPAFVLDSAEIPAFQYGKYQASESGGKLQSVAGVLPLVSTSLTDFLTKATARNVSGVTGFRLHHYDMWLAIQWLYLVENATMDSQTKTGQGRVSKSSAANVDAADVAQATYRGIVGLWGNVYQWMDGARTLSGVIERRAYGGAWLSTSEAVANSGSPTYPITFRPSAPQEFIPNTYSTANDSSATLPDYVRWRDAGEYYPYVGGFWSSGADAGLWFVVCGSAASGSGSSIGGRLARVVL